MVPRHYVEDDPRTCSSSVFPGMEKALKHRENTKEKQWQQYIALNPDGYRVSRSRSIHSNAEGAQPGDAHGA